MPGKVKKIRADLSENMLNSDYFITISIQIREAPRSLFPTLFYEVIRRLATNLVVLVLCVYPIQLYIGLSKSKPQNLDL